MEGTFLEAVGLTIQTQGGSERRVEGGEEIAGFKV